MITSIFPYCYRIINKIGQGVLAKFKTLFDMIGLFYDVLLGLFRLPRTGHLSMRQISAQVLFTGVDSFLIISLIGVLCGITLTVQGMSNMPEIGLGDFFANLMVIAIIRELGPFFASLVVIGRSGAALAAYIGNMQVTKEINALEVMGIDKINFIVLPAFLGMILSLVCLNIYFDIIAVTAGLLIADISINFPPSIFIKQLMAAITTTDLIVMIIKNVCFGSAIAIITCYYGFSVTNIRTVPRAVYKAVMGSIVFTMLFNICLTIGFYA